MYGLCSENSTLKPWKGLRCMPAMKPSTTSRARTSRWESRATTAGSKNARPSRAPRATPRSGWAPLPARGAEALIGSFLPRGPHHLVGVLLERPAVEPAAHVPAREAGRSQQQLHLGLPGPAQPEVVAVGRGRVAARVGLDHLAVHLEQLVHPVATRGGVHGDRQPGLGVRELAL